MVGNIQIPRDLTKVIEVRDTSLPLRNFLIEMLTELKVLQDEVSALETRIIELENP